VPGTCQSRVAVDAPAPFDAPGTSDVPAAAGDGDDDDDDAAGAANAPPRVASDLELASPDMVRRRLLAPSRSRTCGVGEVK